MRSESPTDLVKTKLTPPAPGAAIIARRSLLDRLSQAAEYKVSLLSAPAGFGKTTLVGEWLTAHRKAPAPAAWISLDASDNDPLRFWRYVFTAIKTFAEDAGNQALSLLENSQRFEHEGALTALVNRMVSLKETQFLILEDYHAITNPVIHESITFLLEHLPQAMHLIILTRSDPPLPLARMRARNEILELRAPELRFSPAEIREFFQLATPRPLSASAVEHLAARTEGWPAALRLVALALQNKKNEVEQLLFLTSFTGSHRSILDYLLSDVFSAQPEPVQEFLLQTSFLNRLTGRLCDAVTGRENSAQLLDQLERAGLFLETLDESRRWYRFHGLFAEAMQQLAQQRLGETGLHPLILKASQWYEDQVQGSQDQPDVLLNEGIETALLAQVFERAARLIERYVKPRLAGNEFHTLQRWLQFLPEPVLSSHPTLAMVFAQAMLFTTPIITAELAERIGRTLNLAERTWSAAGKEARLGELLTVRALLAARQGEYAESFSAAREALQKLPEQGGSLSEIEWRAVSLNLVGWEDYLGGRLNSALPELISARGLFQLTHNLYGILDATLALGEIYSARAEARQAEGYYRQVLAESETAPLARHERQRRQGRALVGLAKIAYDQNRLEDAASLANQAFEIAGENGGEDMLVSGSLLLARIERIKGDQEAAQIRLAALAAQIKRPQLVREVRAWLSWMALSASGRGAAHLYETAAYLHGSDIPFFVRERENLTAARGLVITGKAQDGLDLLKGCFSEAQAQGRLRSELDILVQMVAALVAGGHYPQAADTLRRALRLAYPEGYQRVFLDEEEMLAGLWREATSRLESPAAEWAQELISPENQGEPAERARNAPGPHGLGEILSRQEERILRLLGEGLSNEEIAQELVVSINTVKTHVKSIYRKLQVGNRRAARHAARKLPPRS